MNNGNDTQLEQIRRAIGDSRLDELEWSTILGAYKEYGIECLEDFAKKLVETLRDPACQPQPIDISVIARPTPNNVLKTIVHRVPKYPVLHDGVVYDPSDIVRFNGKALLYIVDSTFGSNIHVVDDPDTIRILLAGYIISGITRPWATAGNAAEIKAVPPSDPPPSTPLRPTEIPSGQPSEEPGTEPPARDQYPYRSKSSPDLRLFSQKGWGGNRLDVRAGTQWSDLTKAWIFWPFDDWNDEVNSMYPTSSVHIFKEHVNFMGSFLLLPRNTWVRNFGDYGWDARVSSVANYG